jgi:hypothetical protein
MRTSPGGFYEIDGRALRALWAEPSGPAAGAGLRSRQDDLWTEASTLIHVHHRMSDDELGLWGAMQRELERIRRTLNGMEDMDRAAPVGPSAVIGPAAVEPAAVEPTAVEPTAVEPTIALTGREGELKYRLVTTVKRGSASNLPGAWLAYATIEDARTAAAALLREDCVQRVMIVLDLLPMTFVEWQVR